MNAFYIDTCPNTHLSSDQFMPIVGRWFAGLATVIDTTIASPHYALHRSPHTALSCHTKLVPGRATISVAGNTSHGNVYYQTTESPRSRHFISSDVSTDCLRPMFIVCSLYSFFIFLLQNPTLYFVLFQPMHTCARLYAIDL